METEVLNASQKATASICATIVAFLSAVAVMSAFACHAASREIPIAMPKSVNSPDARLIADYPDAVDAIVRVLMHKFQLRLPPHTLEINSTREEFKAGLIKHLRLSPELAQSIARFGKAAVGGGKVLLNELAVAELSWPDRIELLAHELTHTAQLELAGNRSLIRQQWLTEGFAEWMGYAVTDTLGLDDMTRVRMRLISSVQEARGKEALPRLAQLNTLAQWVASRNKYGYAATYSFSFLAVEFLIQRHSQEAVRDYFRRFVDSRNYAANFKAAFGESLDDFEAALDRHIAQILE